MLSTRPLSLLHENNDECPRITASKTPGRGLKGRAGLQENVHQNGSMTANPGEKRVALQTPFHQGTEKRTLQDTLPSSKAATLSKARPLGDKTPRPNRQSLSLFTPGPRNSKPAKFTLPTLQDETDSASTVQPPSSSRRKLRTPRASKCFETPVTKGDHWNVSDVSIEATSTFGELDKEGVDELDDSEPEYMPPKHIELPYEPPFELPDYKEVGQLLRTLAFSYPADDTPFVYQFDSDDLLRGCDWSADHMRLSHSRSDDDEIFGPRKQQVKKDSRPPASSETLVRRTASRSALRPRVPSGARGGDTGNHQARPATSFAVRAPDPKPDANIPRPGTSASNTRPSTTRGQVRIASYVKPVPTRHVKEDTLAAQFVTELDLDDDFRFAI